MASSPAVPSRQPLDVIEHLERMFAHDEWANREAHESLRLVAAPEPRALRLLNHVVGAEFLWLARLEKQPSHCAVWPEWTLAQCGAELRRLAQVWHDYFADLAPEDLATPIDYVNSQQQPFTSTISDILTHVVLHSTYHRGQLAAALRAAGCVPPYTDYIHATRECLLD